MIALFLSLAIEPGVNRMARRGWRRGRATATILAGVLLVGAVLAGLTYSFFAGKLKRRAGRVAELERGSKADASA